jgi:protein-L-isoaspartate O-methyltransferase
VFNWVAEYPILIVLAALCRPGLSLPGDAQGRYRVLGAVVLVALAMVGFYRLHPPYEEIAFDWVIGVFLLGAALFWRAPLPFALIVAVVLSINQTYVDTNGTVSVRSFFGVHKVADSEDGRFRVLSHGTTLHGAERIRDANGNPVSGRPDILMYYYDGSAMAQVMDAVRARNAGPIRYAVVGLGAGSLACRAMAADTVHYYEIDPAIVRIARDSGLFHFLSACRPDVSIMLGDARLTLADAPDGAYDIIYVDAFTSDAIPIHLLTREAMAVYLRKLAPHGIVVVHVSNRFLELASVVAGIAATNGAVARLNDGSDFTENTDEYLFVGTVVAVARNDLDFGALAWSSYWPRQTPDPSQWVWTDDYSNIVGAIIRQLKAPEDKP